LTRAAGPAGKLAPRTLSAVLRSAALGILKVALAEPTERPQATSG